MAKSSVWCYMKKGWTAYVQGWKRYGKGYDGVKWGNGTREKTETKEGGKTIITFK